MGYEVDGVVVESCEYAIDLGIVVDSRPDFSQHVDFTLKKLKLPCS